MAVNARREVIVSARELKRPPAKFERVVQSWDTASKATELCPYLPSPACGSDHSPQVALETDLWASGGLD
jgi:hypothetical protein